MLLKEDTKKCSGPCGEVKSFTDFSKDKSRKCGRHPYCKLCQKQYREDNKDKLLKQKKEYYEDNKEEICKKQRQYNTDNNEEITKRRKQNRLDNYEEFLECEKQYREDNMDQILCNQRRIRKRNKKYTDKIKDKQYCCICGESHSACLDFDHIDPTTKFKTVAFLVGAGYSLEVIQIEIDKCQILCANCHREKHFKNIPQNKKVQHVRKVKGNRQCEICGHKGIPSLTFHHRESEEKIESISEMCRNKNYSLEDIINEIKKCDLICENHHRILHEELREELEI